MGMTVSGARKNGRGRRGVPRYGAMADINMTPFIDVILVLLIIFMVAAPLLTTGVSVDLPRASATSLNVDRKPIAVSLNEQGQLYVMDQPIADADLVAKLRGGLAERRRATHLPSRVQGRALRARGADHGGCDRGRVQKGGPGDRADQTIAGSGFGRAAVILGFDRLRRNAWRGAGADPVRVRLGAEIRGQPRIDSHRDDLTDRPQPDHERREERQARSPPAADAAGPKRRRSSARRRSRRPRRPPDPSPRRRRSPSRRRRRGLPPMMRRNRPSGRSSSRRRPNRPKEPPPEKTKPDQLAKAGGAREDRVAAKSRPRAAMTRTRSPRRSARASPRSRRKPPRKRARRRRVCRITRRSACRFQWRRPSTPG